MRLLNSRTLEFEQFNGDIIPPYVVLSHTWGSEEVNYQEMCWLQKLENISEELKASPLYSLLLNAGSGSQLPATADIVTKRAGYAKINKTAAIARDLGYDYFWCDTCCIVSYQT
jgi:hypothetical protein